MKSETQIAIFAVFAIIAITIIVLFVNERSATGAVAQVCPGGSTPALTPEQFEVYSSQGFSCGLYESAVCCSPKGLSSISGEVVRQNFCPPGSAPLLAEKAVDRALNMFMKRGYHCFFAVDRKTPCCVPPSRR